MYWVFLFYSDYLYHFIFYNIFVKKVQAKNMQWASGAVYIIRAGTEWNFWTYGMGLQIPCDEICKTRIK